MVTFNYTEEFLRQAKRLAKRYRSLADDINSLQHELKENFFVLLLIIFIQYAKKNY